MKTRAYILAPNSRTPRAEQYQVAWDLLLNHVGDVTAEERAQAKCWLTYRCADGEVSLKDWDAQVLPVVVETTMDEPMTARWRMSQTMAEVCVQLLHGLNTWRADAEALCLYAEESALKAWPPCVLNYVRARALLAYDAWLRDAPVAEEYVNLGWTVWQKTMATLPWGLFPFRAAEMHDDLRALQVLSFIGMKAGIVDAQETSWCTPQTVCGRGEQRDVPFPRCLGHLSAHAEDKTRVIFPSWKQWPVPFKLNYRLSDAQRELWAKVKAAGVTHVPLAAKSSNLGDDMHAVAALLWCGLPLAGSACVERDEPHTWPVGSTVLACGWWGTPELPKPEAEVRVIVCGFHLPASRVTAAREAGLFAALKHYVDQQGFPAGCRDTHTLRILRAEGVPAQLSGCGSSTLSAQSTPRTLKLAVDATAPDDTWTALTHRHPVLRTLDFGHRLGAAMVQLGRLAAAQSVLTTRLHAALPALALGCPDVRVIVNEDTPNPERWDGYL